MNEETDFGMISEPSLQTSRSESKRKSTNPGEKHDNARKKVKMRDLESFIESAETNTNNQESTKEKDHIVLLSIGDKDLSQVTEVPVTLDLAASQAEKSGRKTFPMEVNPSPMPLDLNTEACGARNSSSDRTNKCVENPIKISFTGKHDGEHNSNCVNLKGIDVDLNAEDVTSSVQLDSHKGRCQMKSVDVSESGSCTGPLEEKDPMKIWREMKQNGFLSSSHGGIPVPKQRGRKSKNDFLKKKMEQAKREQVNRFTKIAAPSGLLNELNPGIINHVRNRKQVHSIIEALVRSEKHESGSVGSKQSSHPTSGSTEVSKRDLEYMADVGKYQRNFPHEEGTFHSFFGIKQTRKYPVPMSDSSPWVFDGKVGDGDTRAVERANFKSSVSHSTHVMEDILALKLSSSTKVSENASSVSNEESSNLTSVSSLSLKAATVASQWLELLHLDIKGRLSALRRSRRRVRAVITTELPFLISKEFSTNQENDPYIMKTSVGLPDRKIAEMHRARWSALFNQMDESLAEEEKQLESWLNQVKEKQLLCDQGLQHVNWNTAYDLHQTGTSENDSRLWKADSSEKELAVNAAAASIYSTCNFLLSES